MDQHNEPAATSAVHDSLGITWVNESHLYPDPGRAHWYSHGGKMTRPPSRQQLQLMDANLSWADLWKHFGPLSPGGLVWEQAGRADGPLDRDPDMT